MVSAPLGRGVVAHFESDASGRWYWTGWYQWRSTGELSEGRILEPPPEPCRRKRFASPAEAAAYFRELVDAQHGS